MALGTYVSGHSADFTSNPYRREAAIQAFVRNFLGQQRGRKDLKALAGFIRNQVELNGGLRRDILNQLLSELSSEEKIALGFREELGLKSLIALENATSDTLRLIIQARILGHEQAHPNALVTVNWRSIKDSFYARIGRLDGASNGNLETLIRIAEIVVVGGKVENGERKTLVGAIKAAKQAAETKAYAKLEAAAAATTKESSLSEQMASEAEVLLALSARAAALLVRLNEDKEANEKEISSFLNDSARESKNISSVIFTLRSLGLSAEKYYQELRLRETETFFLRFIEENFGESVYERKYGSNERELLLNHPGTYITRYGIGKFLESYRQLSRAQKNAVLQNEDLAAVYLTHTEALDEEPSGIGSVCDHVEISEAIFYSHPELALYRYGWESFKEMLGTLSFAERRQIAGKLLERHNGLRRLTPAAWVWMGENLAEARTCDEKLDYFKALAAQMPEDVSVKEHLAAQKRAHVRRARIATDTKTAQARIDAINALLGAEIFDLEAAERLRDTEFNVPSQASNKAALAERETALRARIEAEIEANKPRLAVETVDRYLSALRGVLLPSQIAQAKELLTAPPSEEILDLSGKRASVETETEKLTTKILQIEHTKTVQDRIAAIDALLQAKPFDSAAAEALLGDGFTAPQHALNKKELARKEQQLKAKILGPRAEAAEAAVRTKIDILDELLDNFDLELAEHFFAEAVANRELAASNQELTNKEHQLWVRIRIAKLNEAYENFTVAKAVAVLEDKVEIPNDTPGYNDLKVAARRLKDKIMSTGAESRIRNINELLASFNLERALAVLAEEPFPYRELCPNQAELETKENELTVAIRIYYLEDAYNNFTIEKAERVLSERDDVPRKTNGMEKVLQAYKRLMGRLRDAKKVAGEMKKVEAMLAAFDYEAAERLLATPAVTVREDTPGRMELMAGRAKLEILVANTRAVSARLAEVEAALASADLTLDRARAVSEAAREFPEGTPGLAELRKKEEALTALAANIEKVQAKRQALLEVLTGKPFDMGKARTLAAPLDVPQQTPGLATLRGQERQLADKIAKEEEMALDAPEIQARMAEIDRLLQTSPFDAAAAKKLLEAPYKPRNKNSKTGDLRAAEKRLGDRISDEENQALDRADIASRIQRLDELSTAQAFDPAAAEKFLKSQFTPRSKNSDLTELKAAEDRLRAKVATERKAMADAAAARAAAPPPPAPPTTPPAPRPAAAPAAPAAPAAKPAGNGTSLEGALKRIEAEPGSLEAWEQFLDAAAKADANGKSESGKKVKKDQKPVSMAVPFKRIALVKPGLTEAEAQTAASTLSPKRKKELAEIYLAEGDYEENPETALLLYASAKRLGETAGEVKAARLNLILADIRSMSILIETGNWHTLTREMDRLEEELSPEAFQQLEQKLFMPLLQSMARQPLPPLYQDDTVAVLQGIVLSGILRRAEPVLIHLIMTRIAEGHARNIATVLASPGRGRSQLDFAALLAGSSPRPFLDGPSEAAKGRVVSLYNTVLAILLYSYSMDHPQKKRVEGVLPQLLQPSFLDEVFSDFASGEKSYALAVKLGEVLYPEKRGSSQFLRALANAHMHLGNMKEAARCFEEEFYLGGRDFSSLALAILAHHMSGNTAQVRSLAVKAVTMQPGKGFNAHQMEGYRVFAAGVYNSYGQAQQQIGKEPEAVVCFKKAIELNPKQAAAYNNLGGLQLSIYQRTKKPEDLAAATRTAEQYVEKHPGDFKSHMLLLDCLVEGRRFQDAIREGETALALARGANYNGMELILLFLNLVEAYENLGDFAGAAKAGLAMLGYAYSPRLAGSAINNLIKSRQFPHAESLTELAREFFGDQIDQFQLRTNYGYCFLSRGAYEEALKVYRAVEVDYPDRKSPATINIGLCLQRLGNIPEAIATLQSIPETDPNYLDAQANAASILLEGEDFEAGRTLALALWDRLGEEQSSSKRVLAYGLSDVYSRTGDTVAARHWANVTQSFDETYAASLPSNLPQDPSAALSGLIGILSTHPVRTEVWSVIFARTKNDPAARARVKALIKENLNQLNLAHAYQAAQDDRMLDIFLAEYLDLADKATLVKMHMDLSESGRGEKAWELLEQAPAQLQEDPEIKGYRFWMYWSQKEYKQVLEIAPAVIASLEDKRNARDMVRYHYAACLDVTGKKEEAKAIFESLVKTPGVPTEIQFDAGFALFQMQVKEDKSAAAVDRGLRILRPIAGKHPGSPGFFEYLLDLMPQVPPFQAEEIGLLMLANIRQAPGGMLTAVHAAKTRAKAEGAAESVVDLAKTLQERYFFPGDVPAGEKKVVSRLL